MTVNFLRDNWAKKLFGGAAALAVVLVVLGAAVPLWASWLCGQALRAQAGAMAAALLADGVAPLTVATALQSTTPSAAGAQLLQQIGYRGAGVNAAPEAFASSMGVALALGVGLLLALGFALARREQTCAKALATVRAFAKNDFSARLPREIPGTPGQLLAAVDELALALQAGRAQAQQGREFLKNTISDISHQLKTPLAALALYHDIMVSEAQDPAAVENFCEKSGAALARMETLIQMLLKLARLDAGSIVFSCAPHPLAALAARAAQPLTARAAQEKKTLTLQGDEALTLCCDAPWTVEALSNLIKNALDHTAPGGHITVAWAAPPGQTRITVTDDGAGIAPQDIYHIFKRFYRSDPAPDTPGAGLGLPFAKAVAEGQGGALTVQSEPGQGAAFTITFPRLTNP